MMDTSESFSFSDTLPLGELPSELVVEIFCHLTYKDLISCSRVNKRFYKLSNDQAPWKVFCKKYWLETECRPNLTWKQQFIIFYKDLGRYINCYGEIKTAWDTILNFMKENCPKIFLNIKDGVNEAILDEAERSLGLEFPLDFRCSYRIHDGQWLSCPGLMGTVNTNGHYRSESLLDISTICSSYEAHESLKHCIPLTFCMRCGVTQYLAVTNQDGYDRNTVFYLCRSRMVERDYKDAFITGTSFGEWLIEYANNLKNNDFVVLRNDPYRFLRDPHCIETTGYITVSVATCFVPEQSTVFPPLFYHCYRITMSMSDDAPESEMCQLQTRHWIVTDENGEEEEVNGPGVVGLFPVMEPGRTFSWVSCVTFNTTYGSMKGHFKMKNSYTGDEIEVKCPAFHMKCLPYITVEERDENKKRQRYAT